MWKLALGRRACAPPRRIAPATRVPLVDPRSSIVGGGPARRTAWRRDSAGWSRRTSQDAARPIVRSAGPSAWVEIAPSPTTSNNAGDRAAPLASTSLVVSRPDVMAELHCAGARRAIPPGSGQAPAFAALWRTLPSRRDATLDAAAIDRGARQFGQDAHAEDQLREPPAGVVALSPPT